MHIYEYIACTLKLSICDCMQISIYILHIGLCYDTHSFLVYIHLDFVGPQPASKSMWENQHELEK